MSARVVRLATVVAWSAIVSPWQPLQAQPSTEGLADARQAPLKFGVDIGGTVGPLSPFAQLPPEGGRIEQAARLSYLISARDRYPVRVVAGFFQSRESLGYGPGSIQSSDRVTERIVSIGALVDIVDNAFGRGRFSNVRFVTALGVGVAPYVTAQVTCALCGAGTAYKSQGAGAQVFGNVGLRWKRLAIDQQVFALLASGSGIGTITGVPFSMGVRF